MFGRYLADLLIAKKITIDEMIAFLKKHNLLTVLPSILAYLKHKEAEHLEFNTLVVETPFPLQENALESIKARFGTDVRDVEVVLKKDLLAGYVARLQGVEVDASAKRVLENFIRS